MRPINKKNFGVHGLAVKYYNGSAVADGYIVRQIGSTRFVVTTDGTNKFTASLAPTTAIATALATQGNHGYCTMLIVPSASASGGTFTAHFGIDQAHIAVAGAGTGYQVNDVLNLTGISSGTVTVSAVNGGGGVTAVTALAAGDTTTLPANPVATTSGSGTGATFTVQYKLLSVASSGGTGYSVGEAVTFTGMTATVMPTAHVSTATNGAATAVTVDTPGSGISAAGSGPGGGAGTSQHVKNIETLVAFTTEGNRMHWTLGMPVNGSAYIATYS